MLHRRNRRWRMFRPRTHHPRFDAKRHHYRDRSLDKRHITESIDVNYVCNTTDFFDCAEDRLVSLLQRRPEVHDLDRKIDALQARFMKTHNAQDGLVALLAQAPRAVLAQLQMDSFPQGYRNKQERLYELIDFNDTLVATILQLDDAKRTMFAERVKQAADRICMRVGAPTFEDDQWTAIIRGLTREVAVYLVAVEHGFAAVMPDRAHDALGIDIQVQDPQDKRYINIDVKTPSAFRRRMEQLVHEGRLSERELLNGDKNSYIIEHNGHGEMQAEIVMLCILPDLFGDLANWRFVDPEPMRMKLNKLIREHGLSDDQFGQTEPGLLQ